MEIITKSPDSDVLTQLINEKSTSNSWQERRHEVFDDIYSLYRGKTKTNRITQRQALVIPIMKETIKTLLSRIDDVPDIYFEDRGNDKQKELFLNELWKLKAMEEANLEGIDVQDKKSVLMYGRSTIKLNFIDEKFKINPLDIYDFVIDPKVEPIDIETAHWIIHQNIMRRVRDIASDERYDKENRKKLVAFSSKPEAKTNNDSNKSYLEEKQQRMKDMGVEDDDINELLNSDEVVNLTEHYTEVWDEKAQKFVRYVYTYANDSIILLKEKLSDLIGVEFYPFVSWGDDMESQDFWSDGAGDIAVVINKILNIFFSQMAENRTLRNFGMYWFNATVPNYNPPTFEPGAWKMFPAPGEPDKQIKQVQVPELRDILPEINFLIQLIERATAATAMEKGMAERKQITLGEIQLLAGRTAERITSIAKFYRRARKELADKWYRILEANVGGSDIIKLYKKSIKGNMYEKAVKKKDWYSKEGFSVRISSSSEQEEEKLAALQRFQVVKQQFPNNPVFDEIMKKRTLGIIDLTPEEVRAVLEAEKKIQENQPTGGGMMAPQPQIQLKQPQPLQPA